jgi:hypothetical protein
MLRGRLLSPLPIVARTAVRREGKEESMGELELLTCLLLTQIVLL